MNIWIIVVPMLIAPLWDWLGVTRIASYYTDFDYRYWPLTRLRLISVLLLPATAIPVGVFASPHPPLWPLILFTIANAAWTIIALRDINVQRRTGYRNPPRYSARDEE